MIIKTAYLTKFFVAKKSMMTTSLLLSLSLAGILEKITTQMSAEGIETTLIALTGLCFLNGVFAFADFITGVIGRPEGERIQSSKISNTLGKYFGIMLYFMMASVLILILSANYFVLVLLFGPLILNILKEYISIGENIEKKSGKKPYIFGIVDKLFEMIETRFFKGIEKKISDVDVKDILKNDN